MRKHLLLGLLTAFGFTTSTNYFAQDGHFKCGTTEQLKKLYAEDPQLEIDQQKLMEQYRDYKFDDGQKRAVIVIPIVFHIIHEYGVENITDQQVYDQMRILNEDFRMKNADIANVVPAYQNIKADCEIEFRLATLDPMGNCTNGIEHINSHLTMLGGDIVKMNQWQRNKYLNVWVVNKMGPNNQGAAGYAFYPSGVTGNGYFRDGIMILNDYIGSIGTSSPFSSRALTHEIGHYLGLPHVWGSTNDPNVSCGEDGVLDTPVTKGHSTCKLDDATCTPGVIENVQNFMEYSYCSNMYTKGQKELMLYSLTQASGGRNNLYTEANRTITGTMYDVMPTSVCAPKPEFSMDTRLVCKGDKVKFKDASWKSNVTDYEWTFPGSAEGTSTLKNPTITYTSAGYHDVTLKVSNSLGSNSYTMKNAVYVTPEFAEVAGPKSETFDAGTDFWITQNPEDNYASFQKVSGVGIDKSTCYKLNNYKNVSNAALYSDDFFYYDRLVDTKDYLVSNAIDLHNTTGVTISFDYAYGSAASVDTLIDEVLKVWSSKDCGATWTLRKTLKSKDLLTAGYVGNQDFAPISNNQWKNASFTYIPTAADTKTRFRFEYVASSFSNNLYIDNFNISGALSIEDNGTPAPFVSLSPNPVASGESIAIEVEGLTNEMQLQIIDVNGSVISTTTVEANNGSQTVYVPMNMSKGCYFVNAIHGTSKSTHKVIVF